MSTPHTPGPWMAIQQGFKISIGNSKTGNTTTPHDYQVCIIEDNSAQAEANAKLIAEAPQLASDLVGVAKALIRVLDQYNPDSLEYEWVGVANEAIFKATGLSLSQYQNIL